MPEISLRDKIKLLIEAEIDVVYLRLLLRHGKANKDDMKVVNKWWKIYDGKRKTGVAVVDVNSRDDSGISGNSVCSK